MRLRLIDLSWMNNKKYMDEAIRIQILIYLVRTRFLYMIEAPRIGEKNTPRRLAFFSPQDRGD